MQCIDAVNGSIRWSTTLPGRCDTGLCVTDDAQGIAVACGDDCVYVLRSEDGQVVGSVAVQGGAGRPRSVGPWVAVPARSGVLLILDPAGMLEQHGWHNACHRITLYGIISDLYGINS